MGRRSSIEIKRIWEAQGKHCAVCGQRMVPVSLEHPTHGWTIEHVYNRASRRYLTDGNKLVSHVRCNQRKADREPTGCELILLHAVNAQLGYELTPMWRSFSDDLKAPSVLALKLEQALAA